MSKICNPKVEMPQTTAMNDLDYLTDILETTKNMVSNYSLALNEVSNNTLYGAYKQIFDETSMLQRDMFDLMFQKGWYCLEQAEATKIKEAQTKAQQKSSQL